MVTVTNAAGRVVQTFPMNTLTAGAQPITWDGKMATGERAPAGTYMFAVDAVDANSQPIGTDMNVSGIVSGVDYSSGSPVLSLTTAAGTSAQVALSNIASITQ
jgi:flagellar hook assembly protein FlgD